MQRSRPIRYKSVTIGGKRIKKLYPEDLIYAEGVPKKILIALASARNRIMTTKKDVFLGFDRKRGMKYFGKRITDDKGNHVLAIQTITEE